jgi:hypothetical protein
MRRRARRIGNETRRTNDAPMLYVARSPGFVPDARPAWQADRIERLCDPVTLWFIPSFVFSCLRGLRSIEGAL